MQQVTGRKPKPGQRVLVLELSCEGEEDDTTFPPLHYELCDKTAALSPGSTEPCNPSPQ